MKVNLSRRKFFGASVGAAVATPQLAQSLTSGGRSVNPNLVQGARAAFGPATPDVPPSNWVQEELKDFIRRRKIVKTGHNSLPHHRGNEMERFRLESMRSLSPVTRARLAFEDEQRRLREDELNYIDKRISELKEQLGPLAALITDH